MELGLVLLGAVVGAIFYSVIRELTRTTKNKREIENEIEYLKKSPIKGHEFKINALEWVLNKKK